MGGRPAICRALDLTSCGDPGTELVGTFSCQMFKSVMTTRDCDHDVRRGAIDFRTFAPRPIDIVRRQMETSKARGIRDHFVLRTHKKVETRALSASSCP